MNDLGKWHHGRSNSVECLEETCELYGEALDGFTDAQALKVARAHVKETGHTVTQGRTVYREVRPVLS